MGLRGLNATQLGWAEKIVARVKARFPTSEGRQLAKRALMTALTESALYMYANRHNAASLKLPHDRVGGDHGSVGLYQQQVGGAPNSTANWGTTAQLMDVNVSTDKFVDALRRIDWRNMSAGQACQRVQVSAFPDRYAAYAAWGDDLVAEFWDGAKPGKPTSGLTVVTVDRKLSEIQKLVGAKPDNIPGPETTSKVTAWQKKHGLVPDNIWGPLSDAKGFPKKPSKPKPVTGKAPKFPLPEGSYFGPKEGPARSVSGYYSHAEDLGKWQAQMKKRGWNIKVTKRYDEQTRRIAIESQKKFGLRANGLIGPLGWRYAWEHKLVKL